MLSALVLLLAMAAAPQAATTPGHIEGVVRAEATQQPLAAASVALIRDGRRMRAVATDSVGRYAFADVPAGAWTVRVRRIGYAPLEVDISVPPAGGLELDVTLEMQPVALGVLPVRGYRRGAASDTGDAAPSPELGSTELRVLDASPGMAELGVDDVAAARPGREPADPSDVLLVRGSATALNRVLLDGAPVQSPFHLAGLIAPFDAGALSAAELRLGGAPARYDGGVSYILDLRSRAGRANRFSGSGAVDILSAEAAAEGPVGDDATFRLRARSLHPFGVGTFWDYGFPYRYADALARFDASPSPTDSLAATVFWNRESVRLAGSGWMEEPPSWGNTAASVRYRRGLEHGDVRVGLAAGRFRATLPLFDGEPAVADGAVTRARLTADAHLERGRTRVGYGASFERVRFRQRLAETVVAPAGGETAPTWDLTGDVAGAYIDARSQLASDVVLRGGMRASLHSSDRAPRLAPRLEATWLLTPTAALTLASGRYHQFVRRTTVAGADSVASRLRVAGGSHLTLRLEQRFGTGARLGFEGYFKRFDGVPELGGVQASGAELWLRHSQGEFAGWFGYSLEWVWSAMAASPGTDRFAGRHLVSAGVSGPIGERAGFDVRASYGAGLPYAAVARSSAAGYNTVSGTRSVESAVPDEATRLIQMSRTGRSAPPEPYLRFDAELSYRLAGHDAAGRAALDSYLKVLNALDRRGALFYHLDAADGGTPRPLATLPLLPVVGLRWRF